VQQQCFWRERLYAVRYTLYAGRIIDDWALIIGVLYWDKQLPFAVDVSALPEQAGLGGLRNFEPGICASDYDLVGRCFVSPQVPFTMRAARRLGGEEKGKAVRYTLYAGRIIDYSLLIIGLPL
jgi:hypothetical protein